MEEVLWRSHPQPLIPLAQGVLLCIEQFVGRLSHSHVIALPRNVTFKNPVLR
jgi:hypothetical protein